MSNFREVFTNRHVVLPVIHIETPKQTLDNATIAYETGADGVFLISMRRMNHREVLQMHKTVRQYFATWWIGINYLDLPAVSVFDNIDAGVSGVWVDNAEIYEWLEKQVTAEKIKLVREKSNWKGLYFGGIAFKYQPEVNNVGLAAKIATSYMDVVTTSGTKTGSAPDLRKIEIMKNAIGDFPLAIASGISPENIEHYLKVVDCFLVATSLLLPETELFDPKRVKDIVDAVRG